MCHNMETIKRVWFLTVPCLLLQQTDHNAVQFEKCKNRTTKVIIIHLVSAVSLYSSVTQQ